jgi:hypothetical protein
VASENVKSDSTLSDYPEDLISGERFRLQMKIRPRINEFTRSIYKITTTGKTLTEKKAKVQYETFKWKSSVASAVDLLQTIEQPLEYNFSHMRGDMFIGGDLRIEALDEQKEARVLIAEFDPDYFIDIPLEKQVKNTGNMSFVKKMVAKENNTFKHFQRVYLPNYLIYFDLPMTINKTQLESLQKRLLENFDII